MESKDIIALVAAVFFGLTSTIGAVAALLVSLQNNKKIVVATQRVMETQNHVHLLKLEINSRMTTMLEQQAILSKGEGWNEAQVESGSLSTMPTAPHVVTIPPTSPTIPLPPKGG